MLTESTSEFHKLRAVSTPFPLAGMLLELERSTNLRAIIVDKSALESPGAFLAMQQLQNLSMKIVVNMGTGFAPTVDDPAGFSPDLILSASDVSAGRPEPWLIMRALERLHIFPSHFAISASDDVQAVEEGRNAGVWTAAVLSTPKVLGLSLAEAAKLKPNRLAEKLSDGADLFRRAGVHYVAEKIVDLPAIVDAINKRMRNGERP